MARLILASASPRRATLLLDAGIRHEAKPTDVDERIPRKAKPTDAVVEVATRKAKAVHDEGAFVLAADTLVIFEGKHLGKPADELEAHAMLCMLSGSTHEVVTGVVVRAPDGRLATGHATTKVTFREISDAEIDAYIRTGDPLDKAGAYGIQGRARAFVQKVDGPIDNVIGLPMELVKKLLGDVGWTP